MLHQRSFRTPPDRRAGFTLIELLIVVVVIAILASIAIPKMSQTRHKAVEATLKSDLRRYAAAMEEFYADNYQYGTLAKLQDKPYLFTLSAGVTMVSEASDGRDWHLELTHPGLTDPAVLSCHLSNIAGTPDDGVPVCDKGR